MPGIFELFLTILGECFWSCNKHVPRRDCMVSTSAFFLAGMTMWWMVFPMRHYFLHKSPRLWKQVYYIMIWDFILVNISCLGLAKKLGFHYSPRFTICWSEHGGIVMLGPSLKLGYTNWIYGHKTFFPRKLWYVLMYMYVPSLFILFSHFDHHFFWGHPVRGHVLVLPSLS